MRAVYVAPRNVLGSLVLPLQREQQRAISEHARQVRSGLITAVVRCCVIVVHGGQARGATRAHIAEVVVRGMRSTGWVDHAEELLLAVAEVRPPL
jgi:hypothetical protein